MNKLSDRNIIKQNYLLNNSSYRLSSLSLDLIMGLITEVKNEDKDFHIYNFSLKSLEEKFKKQINERTLDRVAEELLSSTITIRKGKDFLKLNWVSSFQYMNSTREFEISFDPKLKPYLVELKENFVLGYFSEIVKIRSEYSKRIYMLLRQRVKIKKWKISVSELQDILMVPKSYRSYREFKRSVLNQSLYQINCNSSLNFEFKEIKTGRKVTDLEFSISTKDLFTKKQKPMKNSEKSETLKKLQIWFEE